MIERDPQTKTNAARVLADVGRGAISEHGAQMAVQLLEDNGFQIWEIKPDEPPEPTPPPKPVPEYGSLESIRARIEKYEDAQAELRQEQREIINELHDAGSRMQPVLRAIRLAMEETKED